MQAYLLGSKYFDARQATSVNAIYRKASAVIHGAYCDGRRARRIVNGIDSAITQVRRGVEVPTESLDYNRLGSLAAMA